MLVTKLSSGLFILFLVSMTMGMIFYLKSLTFILSWEMLSSGSHFMEIIILMDWISLLFISLVSMISSLVVLYSKSYMYGDLQSKRFFYILFLFILSMMLMILSPNAMSIMLGWDGLGLTSFCLVLYYQSINSYNNSMLTALMNRIGDICILMIIALMVELGSWNFFLLNFFKENNLLLIMVVIASLTKSAQIPFSAWLPAAMAAPTPVSSLVHSSTLVTAGIYLIIRFHDSLSSSIMTLLFVTSSLTMLMAGVCACLEYDLKKLIALSTLSQLGLMMTMLTMGLFKLSFFHLLVHAMFKSMMFLCAGMLIHQTQGSQDIRILNSEVPITTSMLISSLALCGFPFFSGFYSKDLILELFFSHSMNLMGMIIMLTSCIFTTSYSIRLILYVIKSNKYSKVSSKDLFMPIAINCLTFLSILIGSLLMWLFFFDNQIFSLTPIEKSLMLTVFFMIYLNKNYYFMSNMWFISFLSRQFMIKDLLKMAQLLKILDKWHEGGQKVLYLMKNLSPKTELYQNPNFKTYLMSVITILTCFLMSLCS